ncbi:MULTISPECIES: hypothetical protein [Clostridium]|uniref:hypothetical protein n=1 Tax=Clostridium TaxID=1485 RepID=UPI00069E89B2|nr:MULTISPECIES: hypothetical protein [Clostridium]KOF57417.1 hypothetical protein AGR56_13510 [Clostridium sp. DMHC 10]MCD2347357.1 hypothetical protein [Clostridium guangxiense]
MKAEEIIESAVKEGKWIQNDIGGNRIQCFKLVKDENKLMVIIISDKLQCPISSTVEKIMVMDKGIVLFYDGQYYERVEEKEYNLYKKYITEDEWTIILNSHPVENLIKKDLVSDRSGIYVDVHESIEDYISRKYNKKDTDELNYIYNS